MFSHKTEQRFLNEFLLFVHCSIHPKNPIFSSLFLSKILTSQFWFLISLIKLTSRHESNEFFFQLFCLFTFLQKVNKTDQSGSNNNRALVRRKSPSKRRKILGEPSFCIRQGKLTANLRVSSIFHADIAVELRTQSRLSEPPLGQKSCSFFCGKQTRLRDIWQLSWMAAIAGQRGGRFQEGGVRPQRHLPLWTMVPLFFINFCNFQKKWIRKGKMRG